MNRILNILFIHLFVLEAYASSVKWLIFTVDRKFSSRLNIVFLETILLRTHADIIKLDIEGMEGEVLYEARRQLHKVSEIVLEHHPGLNTEKNSLKKVTQILTTNGFAYTVHNTKQLFSRTASGLRIVHAVRE